MSKTKLSQKSSESVAIIGIGCRFPGGISNPDKYWNFLVNGENAIREVPEDRWNLKAYYDPSRQKSGKVYTRKGGFLDNIDQFDPQFFGISPREAAFLDPQQRLLLETTWESLEDAGLQPDTLRGSKTGVFTGIFMHDYESLHSRSSEYALMGPHSGTGTSATINANRVSYAFDFVGPSLVVDTACSSSLVAVHLACRSLLEGETDLALAGGANALLRPEMTILLCEAGMLSPDGYCKSFDARADGYTRAEGAAVVALKRLCQAEADGDRIYAVIRGTAVNQDGNSDGLTVPRLDSQKTVIEDALRDADLRPEHIQYIEAHGTGTPVGDPIECNALGEMFGSWRENGERCVIGSVKSNFGHTESAAGVAGLIKLALMLQHRQIPPNLHFETPNPNIPFDELGLRVPTALEPWEANGGTRAGGVNSFGFGGTNAHALVEEYVAPERNEQAVEAEGLQTLPLSARSPQALRDVAARTRHFLETAGSSDEVRLADIVQTAALHKGHHPHRLSLAVSSKAELLEKLAAFEADEKRLGMSTGEVARTGGEKLAFVFSGMGQQWWAMGRGLFEREPVFRQMVERCDAGFRELTTEFSVIDELLADADASRIDQTLIAQPCIFSVQVALAALWRSLGVVPDVVAGHSVGEIAAGYVAGALRLEDAIRISYHRGRLQATTAGQGKMLAIGLPAEEVVERIAPYGSEVSLAAVNSPTSATVAGVAEQLERLAESLEEESVFARFLKVEVPYHSAAMDPILPELASELEVIRPGESEIPIVSTVTGEFIGGREIGAAYWQRNVRDGVLFAKAMETLLAADCRRFVEIGAHPVLITSINECLHAAGERGVAVQSLRRNEDDLLILRASIGQLYCDGYPLDWHPVNPAGGRRVTLPTYPWQHQTYWNESEASRQERMGERSQSGGTMVGAQTHPLLGGRLISVSPVWHNELDLDRLDYLCDHRVQGAILYPAAAFLEMALAAAAESFGDAPCVVEAFDIKAPLMLDPGQATIVQLSHDDGRFSIASLASHEIWSEHAGGSLERFAGEGEPGTRDLAAIRAAAARHWSGAEAYAHFRAKGLEYGPAFQAIEELWTGEGEAIARFTVSDAVAESLVDYRLHPVVLDACFQVGAALSEDGTYVPVGVRRLTFHQGPSRVTWGHISIAGRDDDSVQIDIDLLDEEGRILAQVQGLSCQRMEDAGALERRSIDGLLYEYRWQLADAPGVAGPRDGAFLPSPTALAEAADHGTEDHDAEFESHLDAVAADYAVEALRRLGLSFTAGESFTATALAERLGVASEQHRLLVRLLEFLAEDGLLDREADDWRVREAPTNGTGDDGWRQLVRDYPDHHAELFLTQQCGARLDEILTGAFDPATTVLSGDSSLVEQYRRHSPSVRPAIRRLRDVVATIVGELPQGRTLRVLEVGADAGGMLATDLLPWLPEGRVAYVLTGRSEAFIAQARHQFKDHRHIEAKVFDVERNPLDQGYEAHAFDLILSADALHAMADLRAGLENLGRLLASDGLLAALEPTGRPRWRDIVFGADAGWWRVLDSDLRPDHPVMSADRWLALLRSTDFVACEALSDTDAASESLVLARGPSLAAGRDDARPAGALAGPCLIFADPGDVATRLAAELAAAGIESTRVLKGQACQGLDSDEVLLRYDHPGDFAALLEQQADDPERPPTLIYLWDAEAVPTAELNTEKLETVTNESCIGLLHLNQALAAGDWTSPPTLWLVSRGARAVADGEVASIVQSPLLGMGRVLVSERTGLQTRMVDLGAASEAEEIAALRREILSQGQEDEVALRGRERYVNRLLHLSELPGKAVTEMPYALCKTPHPALDGFTFHEVARRPPGFAEVEVRVVATALNFKDVMQATGNLPPRFKTEDGLRTGFGLECSGVVVAVGEGVDHLRVGDEVFGIVRNGFSKYTTTDARVLVRKPAHIGFEEAATIPTSFITAHYALTKLADVQPGERVLIHTATGGLGLAALQIAQDLGAVVLATAGSDEKRDYLRAMGVDYVGNSRSLAFVDEIQDRYGAEAVDVVINTLPGAAVAKGVSLLKPITGRFIELSNVHSDLSLELAPFRQGISFFGFDLLDLSEQDPAFVGAILQEIAARLDDDGDALRPIPHRVFPAADVASAFRLMKDARHIGKVVLAMDEPGVVAVPNSSALSLRPDRTYLLAGGLGGFGLATAQWMADGGARHFVLVGRSGAASEEAQRGVEALRAAGARVTVEAADITDREQLGQIVERIEAGEAPLAGVVHAAMVLRDGMIENMTAEDMKEVLNPKILGAWNLHSLTEHLELDFFVSYSSFASYLGAIGQANYTAANAFLDALGQYQRGRGIPGISISWGNIGEVGYVAQHAEINSYFLRQGVEPIHPSQAWKVITYGTDRGLSNIAVMAVNWGKLARYMTAIVSSPRFGVVLDGIEDHLDGLSDAEQEGGGLALPECPEERQEVVIESLKKVVSNILGLAPEELEISRPLDQLGLDSLMAVELAIGIEQVTSIELPKMALLKAGLTLTGIAALVETELEAVGGDAAGGGRRAGSDGGAAADGASDYVDLDTLVESLSGDDLDAALKTLYEESA
jgi:acyl transferase domain-containing protein/NADPH:quinone reductase-like Zn-dependent oxidoreductase/NADP-dependent 3-hydroxy acid dehydrogenase YdfG/acyl carrier protein